MLHTSAMTLVLTLDPAFVKRRVLLHMMQVMIMMEMIDQESILKRESKSTHLIIPLSENGLKLQLFPQR